MSKDMILTEWDLRPGSLAVLYYSDVLKTNIPSQLNVLDAFYPDLLIEEIPSDGNTRQEAVFDYKTGMIRAVCYHGRLYTGSAGRVSQIAGRLYGTARSGIEKERKSALMIQQKIAGQLSQDPDQLAALWNRHFDRTEAWTEEQWMQAVSSLLSYLHDLDAHLPALSSPDVLFPMDPETVSDLLYRVRKRLAHGDIEGLIDAWIWLLLGALLRNEVRRLLFRYRADFSLAEDADIPESENPDGDSAEQQTEYYYEGDDLDKRFPGIEWYCDRCGDRLDLQEGFHDFVHIWKCHRCGYKNRIEVDEIYDSEEDYRQGKAPSDPEKLFKALKDRTDELDQ